MTKFKIAAFTVVTVAWLLLGIGVGESVRAAYAGKPEAPLPEGTIPLMMDQPAKPRKCLHGHTAIPIPFEVRLNDGALVVHIDLCPICVFDSLQKMAGYPPPKDKK